MSCLLALLSFRARAAFFHLRIFYIETSHYCTWNFPGITVMAMLTFSTNMLSTTQTCVAMVGGVVHFASPKIEKKTYWRCDGTTSRRGNINKNRDVDGYRFEINCLSCGSRSNRYQATSLKRVSFSSVGRMSSCSRALRVRLPRIPSTFPQSIPMRWICPCTR